MQPLNSNDVVVSKPTVHKALQWPAQLISYVFHPIFVPIYVIGFLVFVHPSYFSGIDVKARWQTIIISLINLVAFPLISVLLLKAVGFIDSVFLRTKKDRIIPYMACGIFFFWAYTVFKKQDFYPPIMASFILGVFLAASAGLIANIYFKISMHTIGMGGWLGVFIVVAYSNTMLMTWPIAAVILFTGLVATSRLLVSDHTPKDIYTGLAVGFICQIVAANV